MHSINDNAMKIYAQAEAISHAQNRDAYDWLRSGTDLPRVSIAWCGDDLSIMLSLAKVTLP
jgi:hypothetical protein